MKSRIAKIVNPIIVFLLIFGFGFIPPPGEISELSMKVLGVFIGVLYGWITCDLGWPSLLGILGMSFTGAIPPNELLARCFGSQMIIMLFVMFMLAALFEASGLNPVIADYLLTRKYTQGRPYLIFFSFMLSGFLASCIGSSIAIFVIYLQIFRSIIQKTGLKPYTKAMPAFLAGMCVCFVIAEAAVPFKMIAMTTIGTYKSFTGIDINYFQYFTFAFPICLLIVTSYVLICKYVLRVDLTPLGAYKHKVSSDQLSTPFQKVVLCSICVGLFLLICVSLLPDSWAIGKALKSVGIGTLGCGFLAILMVAKYKGQQILDITKVASSFSWPLFLIFVFLFPVAGCLSSDQLSFRHLLIEGATATVSYMPSWLVLLAVVLVPCLLTQLANNVIICSIFVGIVTALSHSVPYSPVLLSCMVALGASVAMFFPAANGDNVIAYSQYDLVTFGQETWFGFRAAMCLVVVITISAYFWGLLIFGQP